MSLGKLINRLLALSPAVVTAGLAIHCRTFKDEYEWAAYTPAQQIGLLRYQDLVARTTLATKSGDLKAMLPLVDEWRATAQDDRGLPMVAVALDDTSADGVKSEIFASFDKLISTCAAKCAKEKDKDSAMKLMALLDASESFKYHDPFAFTTTCVTQRKVLREILAAPLDASNKKLIATRLETFEINLKPLQPLFRHSEKLYWENQLRENRMPTNAEVLAPTRPVNGPDTLAEAKTPLRLASNMRHVDVVDDLEVCVSAKQSLANALEKAVSQLKAPAK